LVNSPWSPKNVGSLLDLAIISMHISLLVKAILIHPISCMLSHSWLGFCHCPFVSWFLSAQLHLKTSLPLFKNIFNVYTTLYIHTSYVVIDKYMLDVLNQK